MSDSLRSLYVCSLSLEDPLVETQVQEKPLSIALRETREGLLNAEPIEG